MKILTCKYGKAIVFLLLLLCSCSEKDEQWRSENCVPISFDFQMPDSLGTTRANSSVAQGKTVYVSTNQGATWYPYTYDDQNSRWECNTGSPITWSGQTMKLWAVVRSDNNTMSTTTTNVTANQADNGYTSSDFLSCVGTYSYTTGTVSMTLKHQVARLVVNVTNCFDASKMTCQTVAEFPTEGQISIGENAVTVSAKDGSATSSVNLYRTAYNIHTNTATFMAYLLPQTELGSAFKLTCGTTLQYTSNGTASSVKLEAGKTTQINLALQEIQTVWNYDIDETYANGAVYEGTYQTFTAPVTAQYKLEVWGAQGGTYTEETNAYKKDCYLGDEMFTPMDNAKRGVKECIGGKGAYVTGIVNLDKGDVLYVYVGKQASNVFNHPLGETTNNYRQIIYDTSDGYYQIPLTNNATCSRILHEMDGGWNGGGTVVVYTLWAESSTYIECETIEHAKIKKMDADGNKIWENTDTTIVITGIRPQYGGGGGGATDIAIKKGTWDSTDHLYSRIIVAGGGGGACYYPRETGYYDGGIGGGGVFLGISSWAGGQGDGYSSSRGNGGTLDSKGTLISTGCAKVVNASQVSSILTAGFYNSYVLREFTTQQAGFGFGGGCVHAGEGLGGGGGGWFGGSCGTGDYSNGAGGGGSSYAYSSTVSYNSKPLNEYHPNFGKDGSYIPEKKYLLTDVANQGGVNTGNGRARITLIAK